MSNAFNKLLSPKAKDYLPLHSNWETDIKPLMVTDQENIYKLLGSRKIGFYDTCAIMNHSKLSCHKEIALELKSLFDCIIITATIIKELSSVDVDPAVPDNNPTSNIDGAELELLRTIHEFGPTILYMKEEEIASFIHSKGIAYTAINKMMQNCLRSIFDVNDTVGAFLKNNEKIKNKFITRNAPGTNTFVPDFFSTFRSIKAQGDSLGELLIIALCNLWLPYQPPYLKIITDDRSCDVALSKLVHQMNSMKMLKCTRLASIMLLANIIRKTPGTNQVQLEKDLAFFANGGKLKVTYFDARIGFPTPTYMTPSEFYNFVADNPEIPILASNNKKTTGHCLNPYLGIFSE